MFRNLGKIAFTLLILTGYIWAKEIVAIGKPIALTEAGETYMAPKWSPDGEKLAVTGVSYTGITILDFPSGIPLILSEEGSAGFGMEWAPDGKSIATSVDRYEGPWRYSKAVLLGLDGQSKDLSNESKKFQGYPKFSASGDVVYLQNEEKINTFSLNAQSNVLAKDLASAAQEELTAYETQIKDVNRALSQVEKRIVDVELSPSEMQIAYATIGEKLWVVDIDGSNRRFLGNGTSPKWSSDSNWITCMITEDDGHVYTRSDILVYNVKAGNHTNITSTSEVHEMNPEWSPDGNWIAFETIQDGRIWVLQVEEK